MTVCRLRGRHDAKLDIFGVHFLDLVEPGSSDHFLLVNRSAWGLCFLLSILCRPGLPGGEWCLPQGLGYLLPNTLSPGQAHILPPRWGRGGSCMNCFHHNGSVTSQTQQLRGSSTIPSHPRNRPRKPSTSLTPQLCALKFPTVNHFHKPVHLQTLPIQPLKTSQSPPPPSPSQPPESSLAWTNTVAS